MNGLDNRSYMKKVLEDVFSSLSQELSDKVRGHVSILPKALRGTHEGAVSFTNQYIADPITGQYHIDVHLDQVEEGFDFLRGMRGQSGKDIVAVRIAYDVGEETLVERLLNWHNRLGPQPPAGVTGPFDAVKSLWPVVSGERAYALRMDAAVNTNLFPKTIERPYDVTAREVQDIIRTKTDVLYEHVELPVTWKFGQLR